MTPTLPAWLAQVKARAEKTKDQDFEEIRNLMENDGRARDYMRLIAEARQDIPALVKIVEVALTMIEALKRADGATYAADHSITLEAGIAARQYERDCSMAVQGAAITLAAAIKEATDGH